MRDPRHGHLYDLKPLAVNDSVVNAGEYTYYFRVCGKLSSNVCSTDDKSKVISSCQEKRGPLGFHKVAGTGAKAWGRRGEGARLGSASPRAGGGCWVPRGEVSAC